MRPRGNLQARLGCLAIVLVATTPAAAQSVAELQKRFDGEINSVHKAKLLEKLGDAQFEEARRAGRVGDNDAVDFTLEKYRDNVRAAFEALKKQHPDAEKHSNGYRQLEIHVGKGIREVDEATLAAPEPYKPPLQLVRADLVAMDEGLLRLLFPHRPAEQRPPTPPAEKKP
jgi:hypothetical protein